MRPERKKLYDWAEEFCHKKLKDKGEIPPTFAGMTERGDMHIIPLAPFMRDGNAKEMGRVIVKAFAERHKLVAAVFFSEMWTVAEMTEEEWNKPGTPMPRNHPRRIEGVWISVEDDYGAENRFFKMLRKGKRVWMEDMEFPFPLKDMEYANAWSVLAPVKSN